MNPYSDINRIIQAAEGILTSDSLDQDQKFLTLVLLEAAADKARSVINPPSSWQRKLFKNKIEVGLNQLRSKISDFSKTLSAEKRKELLSELGRSIQTSWTE